MDRQTIANPPQVLVNGVSGEPPARIAFAAQLYLP
jgi:hypothetical protein